MATITKAKKIIKDDNKKSPGSANKAIETMFRNAYRAQLDLLALAATKSNIMISLNGAIVSILMVASGIVYADTKSLAILLPATLFLMTSMVSIYFALSAASPSPSATHLRVNHFVNNIFSGNFNLQKIRNSLPPSHNEFNKNSSNILIFEEFSMLSKVDYVSQMRGLMSDKDKVYDEMSAQLHHLGTMADHKYTMLRRSYSVFRWGVIVTILAFLFLQYSSSAEKGESISSHSVTNSHKKEHEKSNLIISKPTVELQSITGVLQFTSIYEPSGVQQLEDGRLLIVEDEATRAFRLITPVNQEIVESKPLDILSELAFQHRLNDLEAITMGDDGFLYAITSHKRNHKGKRKKSREQLVRFKLNENTLTNVSIVTNLVDAIEASGVLDDITKEGHQSIEKIDIEALSFDRKKGLLIGLRKPKARGKSIFLRIENPIKIFTHKEDIKIDKKAVLLDLQGGGVRAIRYIHQMNGYLLANEIKTKDKTPLKQSQISFWDGHSDHLIKPLSLAGLDKIDNVEGISPLTMNGKHYILLVGDNGSSEVRQPASFLLLDYLKQPNTPIR